jgi:hypothetical protein
MVMASASGVTAQRRRADDRAAAGRVRGIMGIISSEDVPLSNVVRIERRP